MKYLFYLIAAIIFAFITSCDTTEPPVDNTEPGRRDYVWTIDTIDAPYNTYYRMWGSSPDDIWMVSNGDWDKSIAHFDGKKWKTFGIPKIFPLAIYGFAENEIYISAYGGLIWRYDGASWTKFAELTKDGHNDIVLGNIWGGSPDDFYTLGAYPDEFGNNNSVIFHYNNSQWQKCNTGSLYGLVTHLYEDENNLIYLQVIEIGGGRHLDTTHIYEYSAGKYTNLRSTVWEKGSESDIFLINDEVFFVLGHRIYTRSNNNFNLIVDVNNPNFYQRIWGRNSRDLFLLMTDGLVHYNGNDMEYLFYFNEPDKKPWTQIFGAAVFENEVFFYVSEANPNRNLIYHGKLTE